MNIFFKIFSLLLIAVGAVGLYYNFLIFGNYPASKAILNYYPNFIPFIDGGRHDDPLGSFHFSLLICSLLTLGTGIGLFLRKSWSRVAALGFCMFGILGPWLVEIIIRLSD